MCIYNICGEYSRRLETLNVTITGESRKICAVAIGAPNTLYISHNDLKYGINIPDLILKTKTASTEHLSCKSDLISINAVHLSPKNPDDKRVEKIFNRIVRSDMIRCKFCDAVLANSKKINKVEPLGFLDSLLESETSTYFCHSEKNTPVALPSPLSLMLKDLPHTSALCNGVDLIVGTDSIIKDSLILSKQLESVFCSRCRIMVGRLVCEGSDKVIVFFTNSLNIRRPDRDADGILRVFDIPLLKHDGDYFDLLLHQLIDAQRHRVILSAGTHDAAFDYALIWILGQRTCLYNAIIDTSKTTPISACDNGEAEESLTAEKTRILKVAYHRLPRDHNDGNDSKLEFWNRDFSVTHLRLPLETCISLISFLDQVTKRLAPNMTTGIGPLDGFTIGGIPTIFSL